MKIHKVLNNNSIVVLDQEGNEKIIFGKGIAFSKKPGDTYDEKTIQKVFILEDVNNGLTELVKDIPIEYIQISQDIIDEYIARSGERLNNRVIVALSDHIYTAVQEYKSGIQIENKLLWEIQNFCKQEYEVGKWAIERINRQFHTELTKDEAGMIALHIVNGEFNNSNVNKTVKTIKLMHEILSIIKYHFNIEFRRDSLHFTRFITHLKFFSQRMIVQTDGEEKADDFLDVVKEKCFESYQCVLKIKDFMLSQYGYSLSEEEQVYLTMHIDRVVKNN